MWVINLKIHGWWYIQTNRRNSPSFKNKNMEKEEEEERGRKEGKEDRWMCMMHFPCKPKDSQAYWAHV